MLSTYILQAIVLIFWMFASISYQAIVLTLEGDHPAELKEQALCILANIADGSSSRDFILGNEDVLKKLMNYMVSVDVTRVGASSTFALTLSSSVC